MARIVRRRRAVRKSNRPSARAPIRRLRRAKNTNVPEWASCSVKRTLTAPGGGNFVTRQLYNLMDTTLGQFPRAVQVAQAYQHYRIKKIIVTFKPPYDTFQEGGVSTKPRLYHMIDKAGAIPINISLEGLKQMGARPRDLDEKNLIVSWAPSCLEANMDVAPLSMPSKYKISPWLATNNQPLQPGAFVPSTVDHLGLYWYVDQLAGNPQYQVEVEVQFQFKKPLAGDLSTVNALPAQLAVINNSPDGVVGGSDDHLAT